MMMDKNHRDDIHKQMQELLTQLIKLHKEFLSCEDCHTYTPDMFMVDTDEWNCVVGTENHDLYLCEKCYDIRREDKKIIAGKRRYVPKEFKLPEVRNDIYNI
jgi:hypothetical protein